MSVLAPALLDFLFPIPYSLYPVFMTVRTNRLRALALLLLLLLGVCRGRLERIRS